MKTVVITGGAGYVGSHLARQLIARGDHVRVVDCGLFGFDAVPTDSQVTLYPGTILDLKTLYHAFDGADAVVHLAGLVGDLACNVNHDTTRICNIGGTRFVHTMVTYCKVPRVVFASSCSVYGASDILCTEESPLNPLSIYARTKVESERELLGDVDLPVTVLRFSTVYGHSARPRFDLVANLFTAQAVQDGELTVTGEHAWRPFVHVSDVARAIMTVINASTSVTHQIYNVGGDGQNLTIGQLAQLVKQVVERKDSRPVTITTVDAPDDHRNYRVSFEKIRRDLGWTPSIDMADGIAEMASHALHDYGDYRQPRYWNHLSQTAVQAPLEALCL